jgi:hypothetical protein
MLYAKYVMYVAKLYEMYALYVAITYKSCKKRSKCIENQMDSHNVLINQSLETNFLLSY